MIDTEYTQETSYEEPVFSQSTETDHDVRRAQYQHGKHTKEQKAAQMRRWRARQGKAHRLKEARRVAAYRARKAQKYA